MRIRGWQYTDAREIAAVERACEQYHTAPEDVQAAYTLGCGGLVCDVLADSEEIIVGACIYKQDAARIWIHTLSVLPAYRRSGTARAFIAQLVTQLRGGCCRIVVPIPERDSTARAVAEACGFRKTPVGYHTGSLFSGAHGFSDCWQWGCAAPDAEYEEWLGPLRKRNS